MDHNKSNSIYMDKKETVHIYIDQDKKTTKEYITVYNNKGK
jgi:hypothetical protein